jgi:hypothetical protein
MVAALHWLTNAEPFFILVAYLAFLRGGYAKRLPAMKRYLLARLVSIPVLILVLNLHHFTQISKVAYCYTYFCAYWGTYLVMAVLIFLVLREIYSELMRPVPGLRHLGMMTFNWVAIISGVVAFAVAINASTLPIKTLAGRLLYTAQFSLNCVSILELCMLAFLALTVHSLGRSFRSPIFGIALGFGLEASSQFITLSALKWGHYEINSVANLVLQIVTTVMLLTWATYFFLPEPKAERELSFVPSQSPLLRWNDVAQALGHSTPRVAMGASTGFFLQDVERVVDRVMARNQLNANTQSKVG